MYLTDIGMEDGPYAYVARSHRATWRKARNIAGNARRPGSPMTDITRPGRDPFVATGPKGTTILSDQTGFHRGRTQSPGRERIALALVYGQNSAAR